jgi:PAS domain S-box-containing protein
MKSDNYLEKELTNLLKTDQNIFNFIIECSLDGMWYWDLENPAEEWMNERFWKVLGYDPDEMPHKASAWQDVIFPEDLQMSFDNAAKHFENPNYPYDQIVRYKHKDGSTVWIRCRGLAIRDENGKPIRMLGAHHDLTEIKKAEEQHKQALVKLKESETRLQALSDATNEALFFSKKGICIDANKAAEKMFGYTHEEFIGIFGTDVIAPESKEMVRKNMLSGYEKPYEVIGLRKDGSTFYAEIHGRMAEYEGKSMRITAMRDISFQKHAELKQKHSEATAKEVELLNKAILTTSPDLIWLKDIDGVYLKCNKRFEEFYGHPENIIVGKTDYDFVDKQLADFFRKRDKIALESGKPVTNEETVTFASDGHTEILETIKPPIYDYENKLVGVLGVARDITSHIQHQNELIAAQKKAEESDRLKTEFLNNMSHEVRTPMNGIVGFSQLLLMEGISAERRKNYSLLIQNNSQQLLKVIDDILEMSSLRTKQIETTSEAFNLNSLLTELFAEFNILSKERKVPIYIKKGLRNIDSNIYSDHSKLKKILYNLLENSLKFTNDGHIEIGYTVEGSELKLYVEDTGIGISSENKKYIFERFSQEEKDLAKKYGGLGLGLSISKENANLLGGTISFESEKGVGSTFTVTIPFKPVNPINESENNQPQLSILLAEDEEINVLLIDSILEQGLKEPYKIINVKNGQEAVEACEKHDIDIILMDIKMPIMNGLTATKLIKNKYPAIPIIAQTAYSSLDDTQKALDAGCDSFISKPINNKELIEIILKYLA